MPMPQTKFLFFAPLADEVFYEKLCIALQSSGHQIQGYLSDNQMSARNTLSSIEWINCRLLYQQDTVRKAVNFDLNELSFGEYTQSVKDGERYFLMNLDRLSAIPNSSDYNIRHYQQLVSLFTTVLERWKITHVYFANVPHFAIDLALYYVAKGLNIEVLFPSRTDYQDYFILRTSFQSPPLQLNSCNDDFLNKNNNQKSFYINHSSNLISLSINFNSNFSQINSFFFIKIGLRFIKFFAVAFLTKKNMKDSSLYCIPKLKLLSFVYLIIKRFIQNQKLYKSYISLSRPPTFSSPYVYFALHFQPERSTLPEGGEYSDQISVVRHLSRNLPKGWKLYVKEHPRQFDSWPPDLRKMHARQPDFYEIISAIKNVELISIDFNSEKLISLSKIAITVTGSSGWQAMMAGVPAITFGRAWYSDAPACRLVKNIMEVGDAIKDLSIYSKDDVVAGMESFLSELNQFVVLGYDKLSRNTYSVCDINQRVESFTQAINIFINRNS
jgi:hypothetical protein